MENDDVQLPSLPKSSKYPVRRCLDPDSGLLTRCLWVQAPTQKVFGRLGTWQLARQKNKHMLKLFQNFFPFNRYSQVEVSPVRFWTSDQGSICFTYYYFLEMTKKMNYSSVISGETPRFWNHLAHLKKNTILLYPIHVFTSSPTWHLVLIGFFANQKAQVPGFWEIEANGIYGTATALRIQVCPKKGISLTILFWGWNWVKSILLWGFGSGFLGRCFIITYNLYHLYWHKKSPKTQGS